METATILGMSATFTKVAKEILADLNSRDIAAIDADLLKLKMDQLADALDNLKTCVARAIPLTKAKERQILKDRGLANSTELDSMFRRIDQEAADEIEKATKEHGRKLEEIALVERKLAVHQAGKVAPKRLPMESATIPDISAKFISIAGEILADLKRRDFIDAWLLKMKRDELRDAMTELNTSVERASAWNKAVARQSLTVGDQAKTGKLDSMFRQIEQEAADEIGKASVEHNRILGLFALMEPKPVLQLTWWKKLTDLFRRKNQETTKAVQENGPEQIEAHGN